MSFNTRVKKLTNYTYSPTDPASEDAIRIQIDDSIQEVYDNTQTALADTTGSGLVGYSGAYATVEVALQAFEAGGSGTIPPDGTITNGKLATDVKVGSLAALSTTVKTDVVSAINEDVANLNIIRIAETDTGSANTYLVDTPGTFSRVDGNTFPFIPNNNNTGASTINEDGNGVASIKKYVDGAWIDTEEGDIKKFQKVDLTWNASESAFTLAPKGGANPFDTFLNTTQIYKVSAVVDTAVERLNVSGSGWVMIIAHTGGSAAVQQIRLEIDGADVIGSPTTTLPMNQDMNLELMFRFKTGFRYFDTVSSVGGVVYKLGDDFEEATAVVYSAAGDSSATTKTIDVSGSGWLVGVATNRDNIRIDIDGGTITPTNYKVVRGNYMVRFETSLEIWSPTLSGTALTYYLD